MFAPWKDHDLEPVLPFEIRDELSGSLRKSGNEDVTKKSLLRILDELTGGSVTSWPPQP